MNIYEDEYDKVMDIAKELKLDKEVKALLKTASKGNGFDEFIKYLKDLSK